MEIVISVLVAYLLSGVSQVIKDLQGGILGPRWAWQPTVGRAIFVAATWAKRPIINNISPDVPMARAIVFGLLAVVLQMSVSTGFILFSITVASRISDNMVLQILTATALVVVSAPFVLPLIGFLAIPITLLVSWPLDLLFPKRESIATKEIKWCRNCKHCRRSKEYEDAVSGLWRSTSMPRSDKLPCNIGLETAGVWERYFKAEPDARTLFPSDCEFFEKHT